MTDTEKSAKGTIPIKLEIDSDEAMQKLQELRGAASEVFFPQMKDLIAEQKRTNELLTLMLAKLDAGARRFDALTLDGASILVSHCV